MTAPTREQPRPELSTIAREWSRIGLTGFGGPPAHIALLRRLAVERAHWFDEDELERAIAACNLLPGPASTQLAIYLARRLRGALGALIGGLGFIVPSVVMITALSALYLAQSPPSWIRGAAGGAGAAVAAVAVRAGSGLVPASWRRAQAQRARSRWLAYMVAGALAAALVGPYLVLVLLSCGLIELGLRARVRGSAGAVSLGGFGGAGAGGLGALVWVALKVGALSFGGGFVIVPLMQGDAVHTYHWMTPSQFLGAVALGQLTPGPVVATIAAVGYGAHGVGGAALAAGVAFLPSFVFVVGGAPHFDRVQGDARVRAFLEGAGPAAIGAILGSAVPLAGAITATWQIPVLAAAAIAVLALRRGIVPVLVGAGIIGAGVALAGGQVP